MSAHKKVMFVDDEEAVRVSFDRYLSQHGFDVTTAEDGEKAITKLRQEHVDVVVADLKMPKVDGVQLLEWIHDKQPETRFILLTGYGNEEVERKVRELGAYEYLNKPISPDALSAVLTAATLLKILPGAAEAAVPAPVTEPARPVAVKRSAWEKRFHALVEVPGGLIAAPILGLAFVIFLPVIGFGALAWVVGQKIWKALRPAAG
jgi:DNA-binding NtrC family response regulator